MMLNTKTVLLQAKTETAIRYAEILLIYAEALNELDGSYDIPSWDGSAMYTLRRDVNELKKVSSLFVFVQVCLIIPLPSIRIKKCSGRNSSANVR